ncbi:hypothetical protein F1542_01420 [Komagataeibacter sp. FXV3]|nr:hypothetical protein [Komagataeibacter sp. FXV3]
MKLFSKKSQKCRLFEKSRHPKTFILFIQQPSKPRIFIGLHMTGLSITKAIRLPGKNIATTDTIDFPDFNGDTNDMLTAPTRPLHYG